MIGRTMSKCRIYKNCTVKAFRGSKTESIQKNEHKYENQSNRKCDAGLNFGCFQLFRRLCVKTHDAIVTLAPIELNAGSKFMFDGRDFQIIKTCVMKKHAEKLESIRCDVTVPTLPMTMKTCWSYGCGLWKGIKTLPTWVWGLSPAQTKMVEVFNLRSQVVVAPAVARYCNSSDLQVFYWILFEFFTQSKKMKFTGVIVCQMVCWTPFTWTDNVANEASASAPSKRQTTESGA